MSPSDGWSPSAYGRFAEQRSAPFDDLLALVSPAPGGALLDLGCGTGELTVRAHQRLQAGSTLGLDSSAAMLAKAPTVDGVRFEQADLTEALPPGPWDRVISNSTFNWVPEHRAWVPKLLGVLAPGGQLAVQVPSHVGTPFWACAEATAARFADELEGFVSRALVETPETYAELLAQDPRVERLKVGAWYYPQLHHSVDGLVSFAQGGLLSAYRARLSPESFERFCACYREELKQALGDGPVFFAFKRVFFAATVRGAPRG